MTKFSMTAASAGAKMTREQLADQDITILCKAHRDCQLYVNTITDRLAKEEFQTMLALAGNFICQLAETQNFRDRDALLLLAPEPDCKTAM